MKKYLSFMALIVCGCASPQQLGYSPPPTPAMNALLEERANTKLVEEKVQSRGTPFILSTKFRHGIESDLRNGLKDPDSARFGVMNAVKQKDGTISICGWVNAKNSYGGYTGETPFIAVYSTKTGHAVMGPIDNFELIQPICVKDGLTLESTKTSSFPPR
jgi:hypothetical protein